MNNKKRKFEQMDVVKRLGGTVEEAHLRVKIPSFLPCEICQKPVFQYQSLKGCVACSYECFSIWKLSQQTTFLDEKPSESEFDNALKRSKSIENIDDLNTEH